MEEYITECINQYSNTAINTALLRLALYVSASKKMLIGIEGIGGKNRLSYFHNLTKNGNNSEAKSRRKPRKRAKNGLD